MLLLLPMLVLNNAFAYENNQSKQHCAENRQFVFSWQFRDDCEVKPRGGTTKGTAIKLDPAPHPGWLSLQEQGLSDFEKDRRAILAMAGPYRTSFDFLEVTGFNPGYTLDQPYQSWGTEYVYVVEDRGDFISLQHIMVMYFEDENFPGPMVMKHWRQDWQYEKTSNFEYVGNSTWQQKKLATDTVKGTWSQSVYQVDDSPRYESFGRWQHHANFSTWKSEETWRPLPRREFSVRDDYQVLTGYNRHTILHNGWIHEQENYKLVLDDAAKVATVPYLAKELGVNRYERIIDHDFTPGDRYWKDTGAYWQDVREKWSELLNQQNTMTLSKKVNGKPLFMPLFNYADKLQNEKYNSKDSKAFVDKTINSYVK